MRSRRFTKRVQIWQAESEPDGFGGNTIKDELITSSWAELKVLTNNRNASRNTTDFGISNTQLGVMVTLRKRNDINYNSINQYMMYNNEKYIISSFPTNVNFDNSLITFIAVKQDTKSVNVTPPING